MDGADISSGPSLNQLAVGTTSRLARPSPRGDRSPNTADDRVRIRVPEKDSGKEKEKENPTDSVPKPFKNQFKGTAMPLFQLALVALTQADNSIHKEATIRFLRDFCMLDPTPEKLEKGLKAVGYQENSAMSLTNVMDLVVWFIWQNASNAPSNAQAVFEAIVNGLDTEVTAEKVRSFIAQFGLNVEALCPSATKVEYIRPPISTYDRDDVAPIESVTEVKINLAEFAQLFDLQSDKPQVIQKVETVFVKPVNQEQAAVLYSTHAMTARAMAAEARTKLGKRMTLVPSLNLQRAASSSVIPPPPAVVVNAPVTQSEKESKQKSSARHAGNGSGDEEADDVKESPKQKQREKSRTKTRRKKPTLPDLQKKRTRVIVSNGFVKDLTEPSRIPPIILPQRWKESRLQKFLDTQQHNLQDEIATMPIRHGRKSSADEKRDPLRVLDPRLPGNFVMRAVHAFSQYREDLKDIEVGSPPAPVSPQSPYGMTLNSTTAGINTTTTSGSSAKPTRGKLSPLRGRYDNKWIEVRCSEPTQPKSSFQSRPVIPERTPAIKFYSPDDLLAYIYSTNEALQKTQANQSSGKSKRIAVDHATRLK